MSTHNKRFAIYFRETVVTRYHLDITGVADVRAAIVAVREAHERIPPDARLESDSASEDMEIFAADEFLQAGDTTPAQSWELDGISGAIGEPIDIEV